MAEIRKKHEKKPIEMFTETEQEEIRLFADRITPASWIFPKTAGEGRKIMRDVVEGAKYIVGNVYMNLFFFDEQYDEENPRAGGSGDPMHYLNGAAFGSLSIFYHTKEMIIDGFTWKGTIIHELAHNAVDRYLLWKEKPQHGMAMRVGLDMHGPIFYRALRTMLQRAIKYDVELADDVIDEIVFELDQYAVFYDDKFTG